jgi:hypothetical protein
MSEVDDARRSLIRFLTLPGISPVLLALLYEGGSATFVQLHSDLRRDPAQPLRTLAVYGYVTAAGFSFDDAMHDDAMFSLTSKGVVLAEIMHDLSAIGRRMAPGRRPVHL